MQVTTPPRAILSILRPRSDASPGNVTQCILQALEMSRKEEITCAAVVMRTDSGEVLCFHVNTDKSTLSQLVGCIEFLKDKVLGVWRKI